MAQVPNLQELRVKFKFPIKNWMGWSEKEVLEPLRKFGRTLAVFEVEIPSMIGISWDEVVEITREVPYRLVEVLPTGEKRTCGSQKLKKRNSLKLAFRQELNFR